MPDSYTSIFGVEAPQFEVASTVIELDYVRVVKDEPDLDDIIHSSVKTGHKEWTRRGKHWVFEVIVNLTKYGSNAYDKYQELKSYKYSLVDKLWKRRDGTQIQNDDDEDVKFFIEEIKEFYFDHYLYPDRLKMRFVSQDPIDLAISSGSTPTPTYDTPETILEIYGENWDGSALSGHIGPSVVETGSVVPSSSDPEILNGKKVMICNAANEYLRFTADLNTNSDNYVLFIVGKTTGEGTGYAHYGIDLRKSDSSEYRIIFPIHWTGGNNQFGYLYGVGETNTVMNTVMAYNTQNYFIRCLILKNTTGKLYLEGGDTPAVSGGWTPCPLGGSLYRNRINENSSNVHSANMAHISIHKFPVSSNLLDLDWVNAYGNALQNYYNLTWNNITVQP